MRIGVTNAVLSNSGDAAIFEGILTALQQAGVTPAQEIVVFDSNERATSRLYPDWTIRQQLTVSPPRSIARIRAQYQRIRLALVGLVRTQPSLAAAVLRMPVLRMTGFARSYAALRECDVIISSGGTYLVDHYNFGPRSVELTLASELGATVFLWTQSMGPFVSDRAVRDIKKIGAVTDAVFFRDARSKRAWESVVEHSPHSEVVPDVVFALPGPVPKLDGPRRPTAVVSVREWARGVDSHQSSYSQYRSMFRAGIDELASRSWQIRALSTCQGVPSYAYDDSAVAAEVFAEQPVSVDEGFHTPRQLLNELSEVDLVVTTRMHLAILAILAQKPVIAIAYEFKTLELFRSLGLDDFVIRIEDANDSWLVEAIDRVLTEPSLAVVSSDRLGELREHAGAPARAISRMMVGQPIGEKKLGGG